ncbi:GTP 3',8-cyclase MoaA [Halodesulfovibrio marinisediminis]|uniref:GTP 3',8-cyclase n=1 Tax=Halodesulfovibrio marinisediminis DSM 17456 TaxID=1121457 RepID=A0A1N6HB88_9BACT|nr:GTP 3',8-cyclase MoaA [Halodesulfovibrio marinisediminis]SIO17030.1 cyclic pyranopterin monophosphate synthase subunit MoaA [Halodesulfovibrio marinisediminis DSM 17456]
MTHTTISPQTKSPIALTDSHGRTVNYLRVSVTDRCNLRCMYCWSADGMKFIPHENIISYEEIARLVDLSVDMGVSKVRLTGGEPFARRNFLDLVKMLLSRHPDLDLRLTTNATMMNGKAKELAALGVRHINISLDTFDRNKFQNITGRDMLRNVTRSIDDCLAHGLKVKINTVALKGINDDELPVFVNFAKSNPVDVRFIEFMPMGSCSAWNESNFWSADDILKEASKLVVLTKLEKGERRSGPAKLFGIEGGKGRLGLITPMSNHFCSSCNRLRITANGMLRTCLFSDSEIDLRTMLRKPSITDTDIANVMREANVNKPLGVELLNAKKQNEVALKRMNAIGG